MWAIRRNFFVLYCTRYCILQIKGICQLMLKFGFRIFLGNSTILQRTLNTQVQPLTNRHKAARYNTKTPSTFNSRSIPKKCANEAKHFHNRQLSQKTQPVKSMFSDPPQLEPSPDMPKFNFIYVMSLACILSILQMLIKIKKYQTIYTNKKRKNGKQYLNIELLKHERWLQLQTNVYRKLNVQ